MLGTLAIYIHEMGDEALSSLTPAAAFASGANSHSSIDTPAPISPTTSSKTVTSRDTTMTFTTFVLFDMFNALTCRSESKSILFGELRMFGNKMFNYAVAGSLAGQACVIYLPFLQRVFQTEALGFRDLMLLAAIASSVFWVDEGRKFYEKRKRRRGIGSGYSASV